MCEFAVEMECLIIEKVVKHVMEILVNVVCVEIKKWMIEKIVGIVLRICENVQQYVEMEK
jgi:hypothetical protein